MRKFAFGAALSVFVSLGNAYGADLYSGGLKDPPAYAPVPVWTGFYLGATAGYGWADGKLDVYKPNGTFFLSFHHEPEGALGGVEAGYNWEIRQTPFARPIIVGVEADASASGLEKTGLVGVTGNQNSFKQSLNGIETVRGRVGLPVGEALPFVTGGAAFAQVEGRTTQLQCAAPGTYCPAVGTQAHSSATLPGWVVGGGIEYALSANWSAKAEYLHIEFDQLETRPKGFNRIVKEDITGDVVRAGVNYRIGSVYDPLK
jgi:outer membrane immunogenic protein